MNKLKIIFLSLICALVAYGEESKYAISNNVKIHYQIIGEGDPILIINGGPGFSSDGFLPLAKSMADLGYQTIIYDQRGTGKSTLSVIDSSTITMDLMNADIEAIRKDLGFSQWVVFGHSFGGMMANYYATKYPEKIAAMILSSSGGIDLSLLETAQNNVFSKLSPSDIDSLNYWRAQMAEGTNFKMAQKQHANYLAKACVYNQKYAPIVSERLMQANMGLNSLVWRDLRRIDFDCKKELSYFDKPVLIIQGKDDIVSEALALKADSVFAHSTLVLMDSCRHYGWLDQPHTYFNHIADFLAENSKSDESKIKDVIHNYVQSIYENDAALLEGIADSTLQKSGYYWSNKNKKWSYDGMTFTELKHTAEVYNQKDWIPKWAPVEIELFEVKEKIASAKVSAIWGFDYILLSKKADGSWTMDKILWQSYTENEAKAYFGFLKAAYEGNL